MVEGEKGQTHSIKIRRCSGLRRRQSYRAHVGGQV